ncbi:hypothetical protein CsatA_028496 [Cannabis sativa]
MPSNGIAEVGTVMGADSWPELESVRASAKSSSDSLKALSDGLSSVSISQFWNHCGCGTHSCPYSETCTSYPNPQPCCNCSPEGTTKFLFTVIPHFRKILLSAFECTHCGERNNEVQFAGEIQPKGCNCRLEVPAGDPKMLDRQVVKFEFATIKVFIHLPLDMDVDIDHYTILGLPTGQDGAKLTEKKISKVYTCN